MAMWIKVLIGGGIGLLAGVVLGHFGKCSSGACPFTANPYRGAMFGLLAGILVVLAMGRTEQVAADNVPRLTTVAEFEMKVLKADRPVLVDFYADRCPPCRRIAPTISKLKAEYEGKAGVFKVDVDNARELAGEYEIRNIPTVMLFDKGEIVKKWIGLKDESTYRGAIEEALSKREGSTK